MIARTAAFEPGAELQRGAELLVKHWVLAIPTAVASLLFAVIVIFSVLSVIASTVLGGATGGHIGTGLGFGTGVLVALALIFAGMVAIYVAQAMVIAAAPGVWHVVCSKMPLNFNQQGILSPARPISPGAVRQ